MFRRQERPPMHSVYLGRDDLEIKVDPETYKRLVEIVKAAAVCCECGQQYSQERPNVAGLLCLPCFQVKEANRRGLTYQGPLSPDVGKQPYKRLYAPYESKAHFFLNAEGHVYTTKAGPGEHPDVYEDDHATLAYWHFPRPLEATWKGEPIDTSGWGWTIYGSPRTDEVLMLQHGSQWRKDEILFIVKRHGQAIQINRRKPMHRALLAAARAELEATRRGSAYFIDGEYQHHIYESDVYRMVARLVAREL